ncbi:MAG TPA: hypothetical protein VF017_14815 [Thermoanaerobaculia bacterium]|nr:hypothetical protein [Thermoanaerobaculia bacterium]
MRALIASELIRYRPLAVGVALAHLVVLRLAATLSPLFAPDLAKLGLALLVYAALGLALGLFQLGSARRPGQWTFLIHRPLSPGRIFGALTAAGLLLLAGVVALPLLAMTLWFDLATPQWVDGRHYPLGLYAWGIAAGCYLLGAFVALARSRAAFLAGVLVLFFLTREAPGLSVFVPLLLVLAWLGLLARAAFKPDLGTPLSRPGAVVASALPIGYALFRGCAAAVLVASSLGTSVAEKGIGGFSSFAWNDYFPAGTKDHVDYLDERSALEHGLAAADADPALAERRRHLRAQLPLASVLELPPRGIERWAERHQLMLGDGRHDLYDDETGVRWSFQHAPMLFQGLDGRTGEAVGWLGLAGPVPGPVASVPAGQRFPEVPYTDGERLVFTRNKIWQVDFTRAAVDLRFELPPGETLRTPVAAAETFVVAASDRTLYFFEPRDLKRPGVRVEPSVRVALPAEARHIARTLVAELVDGYLVTFVLGRQSEQDRHRAEQVVVEVGFDGRHEVVARRPLGQGFPAWHRHRGFWLSPFFQTAHDLAWTAIAPRRDARVTLGEMAANPPPSGVLALAGLVALVSAAGTGWAAKRRGLAPRQRLAWTAGALLLGLPGLLAFLALTAKDEALDLPAPEKGRRPLAMPRLAGEQGGRA